MTKPLSATKSIEFLNTLNTKGKTLKKLYSKLEKIKSLTNIFKLQSEVKEFYLQDMIDKTSQLFHKQLEAKNIILIQNIENQKIISLENELIQVLINVLNNAIDELSKINNEKLILIDAKIKEKNIEILIKDNAGGIKEEFINKIFEAYFTTKDSLNVHGIGLFVNKQIIEKHLNGKMSVENKNFLFNKKEYIGAEFKIIFPINTSKTKEDLSLV